MSTLDLEALRQAGRIAADVRRTAALRSVEGASVLTLCEALEQDIVSRGAAPAFPVQCSIDAIAAHSCPAPGDATRLRAGDLAKWDIGVHVDGHVVDTAVSVCIGRHELKERLIAAAQAALDAALAAVVPGVAVRRIAQLIEGTVRARGFRALRQLCGHGLARWQVHGPPPIPNLVADASAATLDPGSLVAIETFVTDGSTEVYEQGEAEIFRLLRARREVADDADALGQAVRSFRGFPFCRRQLGAFDPGLVREALRRLQRNGDLAVYRPLIQAEQRAVAQAEHTVLVHTSGSEVLTL